MGMRTVGQIAREYQVHPVQVTQWKGIIRDHLPELDDVPVWQRRTHHFDSRTRATVFRALNPRRTPPWLPFARLLIKMARACRNSH